MATIEKTGPSTWRISKYYQGRRYRLSVSRKPTKSEAERLIWSIIEKEPEQGAYQSFETAARKYMDSKSSVLSPSTINAYGSILKNMPQKLKNKPVMSVTREDIQISINDYSKSHSAKSVRNLSGFISTVMKSVRPSFSTAVTLPQKDKTDFYVPEDEDVKRILEYAKGSRYEISLWLATFGLRRGEICALLTSDLSEDNILTVNKSKVLNADRTWTIKQTKTVESNRKIKIADYVAELIRKLPEGEVYSHSPGQINEYLQAAQKKLGIEKFSLHKLRHFFAATARELMGDAYVEKMGGWKPGSEIMKKVYDYTKEKQAKEAQEAFAQKMGKMIS